MGAIDTGSFAEQEPALIELTVEIVSAYVGANPVRGDEIPGLIRSVHASLSGVDQPQQAPVAAQKPAASIKNSITDDYLICLEDGRRFKSLKRHLRTQYNMSPDDYRRKWGLPHDYPMVAPSYARRRSELAKSMGLGQARAGRG